MTNIEIYESNLKYFHVTKKYGDKAQCKCPAHDDKQASLTITRGDKCTLFHCHAGCTLENILSAAGLEKKDTFYKADTIKQNWQAYVENREKRRIEAVYNYVFVNGNYAFTKIRLEGKKMLYGKLENERFTYGLKQNGGRKALKAIYGNINSINKAISEGRPIFIPEGEKDVDTLKKQGYNAFTYGGAGDWQKEFATLLKDATVYILADNDEAGKRVALTIKNDVKTLAKSVKIIVPTPNIPKGDISDYFEEHGKEEFEQLLLQDEINILPAVVENSEKAFNVTVTDKYTREQDQHTIQEIVSRLHKVNAIENYHTSDKGSGALFADIFKNVSRYNPDVKDYMFFDGTRWRKDTEGLEARKSAKLLVDALWQYAPEVESINGGRGDYRKYINSLCQLRNRNAMLNDAKDRYYLYNEDLDKNKLLLNCQNGVLNLKNQKVALIKHDADLLLSKICNAVYNPAATCEHWDKFLDEIMQGDNEKIKYLQKIAGISLTGENKEEKLFILYGATTRNGKSTFVETLSYLLGDYAMNIQPETLAEKTNKDSRTASGDIARLKGVRFVNAAEPPKKMVLSADLIKQMTGRDTITARQIYEREFDFIPEFKLVINTNHLPQILDNTVFSSDRINVILFDRHFTLEEQDKDLKDKLRSKEELSGILNWCIQGLELYRKEGLLPPNAVVKATEEYKNQSDKIGNFISEMLIKSRNNVTVKSAYEVYSSWCNDNGYGIENKKNFISELRSRGLWSAAGRVNGNTFHNVIKGYELAFEDIEEPTPFEAEK